jgi:hypothetical protein
MSLVQQMIGDLAQEGFVDSQGSFSIDVAAAQQKLAQFSLADPYQWVLKMLQAATLLGCKQVAVSSQGGELGFRFEGLQVSFEEFAHCLAALTLSNPTSLRERGLHHLAQALQILKRRGLLLRAAQPGQCFAAQGEHILTRPTDRHWQGNPMLTLVVVRGWSWLQREWPEVEWLRRRAYCSPTRLEFDLQPFSRKLQPPRPSLFFSSPPYSKMLLLAPSSGSQNYTRQRPVFESPGRLVQLYAADAVGENRQIVQRWDFGGEVEGILATYNSKQSQGRLQVWLDGVLSEPVAIPGCSCDAVLSGAGFTCDLSGLRLVENDYLRSRVELVTRLAQHLGGSW